MNRDKYSRGPLTPEQSRFAGRVLLGLILFFIIWVAIGIGILMGQGA